MNAMLRDIVELIPSAIEYAQRYLIRTDVREFDWMASYVGHAVSAKLENQQITGSFKVRGAVFALVMCSNKKAVAASAGNHGLAIAWAGKQLGIEIDIVLPQNASPLKRERILRLGAGVIESGATVEEATLKAKQIAEQTGASYISPFNNKYVIAGQATAIIEFLEQRDLTILIVPTGGGGLLSGAVAVKRYLGKKDLKIVACEPSAFNSFSESLKKGDAVKLGRRFTFADGLATNLEPNSITLDIVREENNIRFIELSEEEIASGCAAVFNRESLLTEGSAAAGVVAALKLGDDICKDGSERIGTILCGGNVHHTTFWQMAAYPFSSVTLSDLSDTLGRKAEFESIRRQNLIVYSGEETAAAPLIDSEKAATPSVFFDNAVKYVDKTESMLVELQEFAISENLLLDKTVFDTVQNVNQMVRSALLLPALDDISLKEQRYRGLIQLAAAARLSFEWRSPGYNQSLALSGFDLAAQGSSSVNYARYEQPGVSDIELRMLSLLGVSPKTHTVLMTSSGMAAFALAFEVANIFKKIQRVLTGPYLYFENVEMMEYWLGEENIYVASSYDANVIARESEELFVDAVLADPLSNHPHQRMVDVSKLAERLSTSNSEKMLIVDGSMLPLVAAKDITTLLPRTGIYFESCSKYMQFGLDIVMAGIAVIPRSMEAVARRVRRNMGLGLDRYGAELFPCFDKILFEHRIGAMEAAALEVSKWLQKLLPAQHFLVTFPGLDNHKDRLIANKFNRTGSCVTLAPVDHQLNRDQLDPIVDAAVREAQNNGVPLVKGVSFGFTTSRLSAASALAESAPPFLRLAVGPIGHSQVKKLAISLSEAVIKVTKGWK